MARIFTGCFGREKWGHRGSCPTSENKAPRMFEDNFLGEKISHTVISGLRVFDEGFFETGIERRDAQGS